MKLMRHYSKIKYLIDIKGDNMRTYKCDTKPELGDVVQCCDKSSVKFMKLYIVRKVTDIGNIRLANYITKDSRSGAFNPDQFHFIERGTYEN